MFRRIPVFTTAAVLVFVPPMWAEPPASPSKPPELTKLEAEAAIEVPIPKVPAGRAPEVKQVADAAVAVRRATWVLEKLLPQRPEGVAPLKLASMRAGDRGWVDMTGEVVSVGDGMLFVRPTVSPSPDFMFALPAAAATTAPKNVNLRGEFLVDRAVPVEGRDVMLLKETAPAKLEPAQAKLVDAARQRLEMAKADFATAAANLQAARKKALDTALERARAEAARQIPVAKDAPAEEQIKAQRNQDDLTAKLAREELARIEGVYSDKP